ncbi:MAG: L-seryl-tRNA(Sec) selenium transferase [Anaerolineales bacterium]|nr:L-seryl-tRNA(Sec) selenium transferase [Anaerolineales bacterium]MCB9129041.1 L-seryl-tRNA(Sec) selenium transferase [Ardenticatenales bacterium]
MTTNDRYRDLPSVDALLKNEVLTALTQRAGRALVVAGCRVLLDDARQRIGAGIPLPPSLPDAVVAWVEARLAATMIPVVNATGVIVHTNLGRAPLSQAAQSAMMAVASGYSNLEFDLETGERGSRYRHVAARLAAVTGADAGLVVNNNAAALVLTLAAVAPGQEVVVSRSQLVEIGGGFRIPEILAQSGAILREVGTTNRTYLEDFVHATTEQTVAYLRVHTSNFRLQGFVHQPELAELAFAARQHGLLLIDDVGSGALLDCTRFGLAKEPMVQASVSAGADLVLFSGDKLLGGPQAGCIVGRRVWIERLRRHPLARALRVDKTTLAALDATLQAYQRGAAETEIPVWQMIATAEETLHNRVVAWRGALAGSGLATSIVRGESAVGGGALPGETLPTWLLALSVPRPNEVAQRLRQGRPAVVARVADDHLLFDPRTVLPTQESALIVALQSLASANAT